ncbi:MAG: flavohemoglobin expression-modulating QEGLA motif protein, partial [Gammaproteobacteria bacterium]|nr:flavohemoglobin expression-modulating QEGLA motif protein [Gammaproteobacteria bacterium]
AQRVFRGGNVRGGSYFTKDLSYVRGFVETVNFIKSAILSDVPQLLPMLFVGKVTLDDIPILYEYMNEGVISPPKYLPSMFRDLNGLYTWFGFSSGMSLINLGRVQNHFEKMFAELRDSLSNRNN